MNFFRTFFKSRFEFKTLLTADKVHEVLGEIVGDKFYYDGKRLYGKLYEDKFTVSIRTFGMRKTAGYMCYGKIEPAVFNQVNVKLNFVWYDILVNFLSVLIFLLFIRQIHNFHIFPILYLIVLLIAFYLLVQARKYRLIRLLKARLELFE
jgi:hypothetical protein